MLYNCDNTLILLNPLCPHTYSAPSRGSVLSLRRAIFCRVVPWCARVASWVWCAGGVGLLALLPTTRRLRWRCLGPHGARRPLSRPAAVRVERFQMRNRDEREREREVAAFSFFLNMLSLPSPISHLFFRTLSSFLSVYLSLSLSLSLSLCHLSSPLLHIQTGGHNFVQQSIWPPQACAHLPSALFSGGPARQAPACVGEKIVQEDVEGDK